MSTSSPLLLDLAGVARLAGVQRPVASMWRARFCASVDPFPTPAHEKGGRAFFDAMSVAQWLARTDHGNNPEAVADAAASSAPRGFDIAEASHVATVDALLTLQAVTGEPVGGSDVHALRRMAAAVDPGDSCLATEVSTVDSAWTEWADLLADAAYSPLEASRILERRHAATRAADGSAGPLANEAEALLIALAEALTAGRHSGLVVSAGIPPTVAFDLISCIGEVEISVPERPEGRGIRRRLLLDGMSLPPDRPSATADLLTVMRLPSADTRHASEMLRALDELVLAMGDGDRAIVLGPARVLTGAIARPDDLTRADVLRSGRVRAIVLLPTGLITSATREALALWVLGRETGDVPLGDRFTAVADLTGVTLTQAARADLTSDVLAAMGSARDVRAHAFRFTYLVRTSSLLASRGALVAGGKAQTVAGRSKQDLPALLDLARIDLGDDAPQSAPAATPGPTAAPAPVDDLIAQRHLRLLSGTRLRLEEFSESGLVVVGPEDLDNPAHVGDRRIDPMTFAIQHPSARLTVAGDVVFRTAPTAKAWVDPDGSKIVAYPARVLRINFADPGGLVPELIAADIEQSSGGPAAWRRWRLRLVAPGTANPLRAALSDLATRREALVQRIKAIDTYAELLSVGVVSGAVTLADDAADAASGLQ